MKKYKVLRAWEGVEIGKELKTSKDGFVMEYYGPIITPLDVAMALHLGFIEEVGVVKKERFVPMSEEKYWYITSWGKVVCKDNIDSELDSSLSEINNRYRTEAEALEARERVLKAY